MNDAVLVMYEVINASEYTIDLELLWSERLIQMSNR